MMSREQSKECFETIFKHSEKNRFTYKELISFLASIVLVVMELNKFNEKEATDFLTNMKNSFLSKSFRMKKKE